MAHTVYRVCPRGDSWRLLRGGDVLSDHARRQDAVGQGRESAREDQPSQLVVHDREGRVEHESSYSDDPFPPAEQL